MGLTKLSTGLQSLRYGLGGVLGGAASPPNPLLADLVADWHMDEASGTRANSIGGGASLAQTGTVGSTTGDIFALAATGWSTANYLNLGSATDYDSLFNGSGSFTVAMRVFVDNATTYQVLTQKAGRWEISLEAGNFQAYPWPYLGAGIVVTAASVGSWQTMVFWHDGDAGTFNIQKNGGTVVSAAATLGGSGTEAMRVGSRVDGGFALGSANVVGPTRLWSRLLTSGERANPFGDLP